jgi:PAS domain S-box-containing protein
MTRLDPLGAIRRSLRARLLTGTVIITTLTMAAVFTVIEQRQRRTIIAEEQRRGEVLARNLAAISSAPLLLYNFTALEQYVARVDAEADVVYAIVLDADNRVAAHSRQPDRVGQLLHGDLDERAAAALTPLNQEGWTATEAIFDFAVPVIVNGQKWGTARVGLSRQRVDAEIRAVRWQLGALTLAMLLVGGVGAAVVARRIAEPVRQLEAGAAAIAKGEPYQRIEPATDDELGRLALAFNHMATELAQQRAALEDAHVGLRRHLEEVADLKSYTDSILASLPSGLVTVDLDGRVVTLNPAAELITGFFAGEAAGRYCTEVFAQTAELGEILMETLATRAPIAPVPVTLRRRNGGGLPIEFSTSPLRGRDGKELGAVGVIRDLSLVRALEGRLRRSDRLAALGELAAGLAHEIKNPLTSLLTFSRHLPRRFEDRGFRERFQRVVPGELERINAIVDRLLELARPSTIEVSLVRLPALLDRAVELFANEIEAQGIRVTRQYGRDVPPIHADEEALYRAFVNLVGNALEAMPAGGRLTIRAYTAGVEAWRPTATTAGVRGVTVEVEDSGTGIPAAAGDRIFNPFYTTKERGTGLGLALTHKIVEDHGGTIDFRSGPGAGTTFRVALPLRPSPPASPHADGAA